MGQKSSKQRIKFDFLYELPLEIHDEIDIDELISIERRLRNIQKNVDEFSDLGKYIQSTLKNIEKDRNSILQMLNIPKYYSERVKKLYNAKAILEKVKNRKSMFIKPEVVKALNEFGDANLYGESTITKELYDELIDKSLKNVKNQIENSGIEFTNVEGTKNFIENITPQYKILTNQIESFYNEQKVSGGLDGLDRTSVEIFNIQNLILIIVIIAIIIILIMIFPLKRKNNQIVYG